jgi:hypothetical protein
MPFIPFDKQQEFVGFLTGLLVAQSDGLVEKSRDMGATWICCAFSVWLWLFQPGSAVGWGSRKEMLVEEIGNPDSIFEKIRTIIRHLPTYCVPVGLVERKHLAYMKCINPELDCTITGESGDNIGRGGRTSMYFKDESAHYERPERIEAALGDNTNVQVDLSSVNGEGNVFHRKRTSGSVPVFVMDWSDHPAKDAAWYKARKAKAKAQGLSHIFAQEVDRDYAAAVSDTFIPAEYVRACKDAHIALGLGAPSGVRQAGLDVADEGADANAMVARHGPAVVSIDQWREGDTGATATKAWLHCIENGIDELFYDSIGVGAGVKAKARELAEQPHFAGARLNVRGFNAGAGVTNPEDEFVEGRLNKDMFLNVKAQEWWRMRDRCYKTYLAVTEGREYPPGELLIIPSDLPCTADLISELSRPRIEYDESGKIRVESKKSLRKRGIPSTNLADAAIAAFALRQDRTDMAELLAELLGDNSHEYLN